MCASLCTTPDVKAVSLARWAVLIGCCCFSPRARAEEPTQPPIHYYPDRYPAPSARTNVLISGALVAGGSYGLALGTSYLWSDAPTASDLRIPVAGPFMAVAGAGCGPAESGCNTVGVVIRTIFATLSGVGQVGGIALLAEGLFMRTESRPAPAAASSWTVSPIAGDDGSYGVSIGGQF